MCHALTRRCSIKQCGRAIPPITRRWILEQPHLLNDSYRQRRELVAERGYLPRSCQTRAWHPAQVPRGGSPGQCWRLLRAESLRVFRSCPLITPNDPRSALQMLAIARAMNALCAWIRRRLARCSVTPEKLSGPEIFPLRQPRRSAPAETNRNHWFREPRAPNLRVGELCTRRACSHLDTAILGRLSQRGLRVLENSAC